MPITVICGPTGSGKTGLALALAEKIGASIVNADSMQIYKGLDIGTAKPTLEERQIAPHYLIDIKNPAEKYSVRDYMKDVKKCIDEAQSREEKLIFVGGTPQYVTSLVEGIHYIPDSTDHAYRAELEKILADMGPESLWKVLEEVDFPRAQVLHPNDHKRIIRALEIYHTTGMRQSDWDEAGQRIFLPYTFEVYAPNWPRDVLYDRINRRVDLMMEQGLLEEAKKVYDMDLPADATCLQAIAYKEFFPYFEEKAALEESVELLKRNSRRYAKRQLTWYKKLNYIHWIKPEDFEDFVKDF